MDPMWLCETTIPLREFGFGFGGAGTPTFRLAAGIWRLLPELAPTPLVAVGADPIIAEAVASHRLEGLRALKAGLQRWMGALFLVAVAGAFIAGFVGKAGRSKRRPSAYGWFTVAAAVFASACISVSVGYDILSGVTSSFSRAGAHVVAVKGSAWFWIIVGTKALAAVFISVMVAKAVRADRR